jgi:hypothetical protein
MSAVLLTATKRATFLAFVVKLLAKKNKDGLGKPGN